MGHRVGTDLGRMGGLALLETDTDLERLLAFVDREMVVAEADQERYKAEQRSAEARYMRGYMSSGYVIRQEILRIQGENVRRGPS